jgi:Na+/citrate or Na+/malate symporter
MLASIHPLGERARGSRFAVTAAAHVAGSSAAGLALGALLGFVGRGLTDAFGRPTVAALLAVAAVVAVAVDRQRVGAALPGPRRQVDEDWLRRYRGWVYGAGYGAQLGLGTVTIVTTAFVYLPWLFALMAGSAPAGAIVGVAFGCARALVVFTMADVDDADRLRAAHRRFQQVAPAARGMSTALVGLAGVTLAIAAAAA